MHLGTYVKVMCVDDILMGKDIDFLILPFQIFKAWTLKHFPILGIYLLLKDKSSRV